MRRLLISAVVLMMVVVNGRAIHAQEPPKWPPDPNVLFAKGVEVIETKEIPKGNQEPITQTPCGHIVNIVSETAMVKRNGKFYICDIISGKLSQPISYWVHDTIGEGADGYGLSVSPDKKWTLFDGAKEESVLYNFIAYELATGRMIDLGWASQVSGYWLQQGWATNTDWYFVLRGLESLATAYAFVATIPDEGDVQVVNPHLPIALENSGLPVVYFDNPPRLEAWLIPRNTTSRPTHFDCTLSVYYFLTHTVSTYHLGNLCIPEYGEAHGNAYYRDVQGDGKAWLVRFNPITRERKNLYYGEIERIYWVSADDAYALIVIDDSGKVDCRPGYEFEDDGSLPFHCSINPVIELVEVNTGRVLYSNPGDSGLTSHWEWEILGYRNEFTIPFIVPIDGQTFTITYNWYAKPLSLKDPLIHVQNGSAAIEMLDGTTVAVVDRQHLILGMKRGQGIYQYVIYDMLTHTSIPLTNNISDYQFYFGSVQDDVVVVFVKQGELIVKDDPFAVRYTIKIPT